jgi:hypothetical protein
LTNLVLDQELDTLDGGGSGLGDSGGNTTHCESVSIIDHDEAKRTQRPGWMAFQWYRNVLRKSTTKPCEKILLAPSVLTRFVIPSQASWVFLNSKLAITLMHRGRIRWHQDDIRCQSESIPSSAGGCHSW